MGRISRGKSFFIMNAIWNNKRTVKIKKPHQYSVVDAAFTISRMNYVFHYILRYFYIVHRVRNM